MVQIAGNQRVSKESTNNDGHTHTVTSIDARWLPIEESLKR
jgi:hypothetical protein